MPKGHIRALPGLRPSCKLTGQLRTLDALFAKLS